MLELPHVVIGATIASKIPNPLISLPLAFLSHLLLDLVPHWNPELYREHRQYGRPLRLSNLIVIADVILSLAAGFWIASRVLPNIAQALVILFACFAAVVIDVIEGFYFYLGAKNKFLKNLISFQRRHQGRVPLTPGLLTQIITILLSLYILQS